MTDETTQALLPVKVTQADRDLIVTLMRPLAKNAIEHKAIDFIAEGRGDDAEAVQLVAKYRLAHSPPSQADAGEDIERLRDEIASLREDVARLEMERTLTPPTTGEEMRLREENEQLRHGLENIVGYYERNNPKTEDEWEDGYEDALKECARMARAALTKGAE